jgi:hypothetical protein
VMGVIRNYISFRVHASAFVFDIVVGDENALNGSCAGLFRFAVLRATTETQIALSR